MARDAGPAGMVITLALAGMLSGAVIVGAFTLTLPRIERNRAEALERAVYQVVPGATARAAWVLRDGELTGPLQPDQLQKGEEAIWAGMDVSGKIIGYAIPAEGQGFQDIVALIYGYDPGARKIIGMKVLESKETPGLGDKIVKDVDFVGQFDDLGVDPEVLLVKKGKGTGANNELDAISGATISSKAVVRIINDSNNKWLAPLGAAEGKE